MTRSIVVPFNREGLGGDIISVWFTHEITISWHALACIYKIVKVHFVSPNRYDIACSKLYECMESTLKL